MDMRLFSVLRIYRAFRGERLKNMAESIGITPRELAALEDGKQPSGAVLSKVITWALAQEEPDLRHPAAVAGEVISERRIKLTEELEGSKKDG
jgi:transcriptional regulator with XRE-family HTH domain